MEEWGGGGDGAFTLTSVLGGGGGGVSLLPALDKELDPARSIMACA